MNKQDFNNTCFYAKNKGDGKLIIEFYESLGFSGVYTGDSIGTYYGISRGGGIHLWHKYEAHTKVLDFSVVEEYNKQDVPELKFPRMMNVWDGNGSRHSSTALVVAYCKDIDYPWIVAGNGGKADSGFNGFENASEIEPTDITQKEIEEKLGYSINIVK
tara:strand:+ start:3568 stop:4044 length:477 start_codon:yes stop_codon:yes gene_type:complete